MMYSKGSEYITFRTQDLRDKNYKNDYILYNPCLLLYRLYRIKGKFRFGFVIGKEKKPLREEAWPLETFCFVIVVGCSQDACHIQSEYDCDNPECQ